VIIPDKVKILGHEYSVVKTSRVRQGRSTTGACCVNLLEIELEPEAPESRRSETFLHEIFEAIICHLDIADKFDHTTMSGVSEVLFAVMRENKLNFGEGRE